MFRNKMYAHVHAPLAIGWIAAICVHFIFSSSLFAASSIYGWVYVDRNNDGDLAFIDEPNPEYVIPNVEIELYSLSGGTETLIDTMLTNSQGRYTFSGLDEGSYMLRQIQPIEWVDGLDTLGEMRALGGGPAPGSAMLGTALNDEFTDIYLPTNVVASGYNFGELGMMPGYVSKRYLLASSPIMPFGERPGGEVPEPTSIALAAVGVMFAAGWRMRRKQKSAV